MLKDSIRKLQNDIGKAKLLVVTKKQPVEKIVEAFEAGARIFGENRVQEILEKWNDPRLTAIRDKVQLHFIGHLQRNKVKDLVPMVDSIDSVDSMELAKSISQATASLGRKFPVFLQINATGESQKFGFPVDQIFLQGAEIMKLPHINVRGLMCMSREDAPEAETRVIFQMCRVLCEQLGLNELSMGMSDDYHIALEEGSTMVRLGRKIFGM